MASIKNQRALDVDDLIKLFDTEPDDYKSAWNELKHLVTEPDHAPPTVP